MATDLDLCNRALQKLGVKRITSMAELSVNGKACAATYPLVRDAELRKHTWGCAIKRVQISADVTAPAYGEGELFTLPSDFIKAAPKDPDDETFGDNSKREGNKILSTRGSPINLRYVHRISNVGLMDPLLFEAIACKVAIELCEELTQSNTKKNILRDEYREAILEAKKADAIEKPADQEPQDDWLTAREM